MSSPKTDLDSLAMPKAIEEHPQPPAPDVPPPKNYAHTLSLRLTAEQYRRLRRYVAELEEATGRRATHQAVFEAALDDYLKSRGA